MFSKEPLDPWHYPRPQLADAYLREFEVGLQSAKGVFAKRRMGKTEFLNKDLLPAAQKKQYLTAYANLWEDRESPARTIVVALASAIEPTGADKLLARFKTPLKKVKATGKVSGLGEGTLETEFDKASEVAGTLLVETLRRFDKTGKKLLIAIDEAQVLASKEHEHFAHALRAALDTRKGTIKVIFAGSSEPTLRRMFGRSSEPFYNWAPLEPFQLLGREFVESMVLKVNELSKFEMKVPFALKAFEALHQTPDFFRRFLNRFLTHAQLGVQAALDATKFEVFNDTTFANLWSALLPADREVLRLVASGVQDVHSKASLAKLGQVLGLGGDATRNTPSHSLRRLQADILLTRMEHGEYRFEDEALREWILAQS